MKRHGRRRSSWRSLWSSPQPSSRRSNSSSSPPRSQLEGSRRGPCSSSDDRCRLLSQGLRRIWNVLRYSRRHFWRTLHSRRVHSDHGRLLQQAAGFLSQGIASNSSNLKSKTMSDNWESVASLAGLYALRGSSCLPSEFSAFVGCDCVSKTPRQTTGSNRSDLVRLLHVHLPLPSLDTSCPPTAVISYAYPPPVEAYLLGEVPYPSCDVEMEDPSGSQGSAGISAGMNDPCSYDDTGAFSD